MKSKPGPSPSPPWARKCSDGATGETTLSDFPTAGDTVGLVWQEAQQNFRLAPPGSLSQPPAPLLPLPAPLIGYWETPSPDSFQSGLSVLSGWVCEADSIVFEIDHDPDQESWGRHRHPPPGHRPAL